MAEWLWRVAQVLFLTSSSSKLDENSHGETRVGSNPTPLILLQFLVF